MQTSTVPDTDAAQNTRGRAIGLVGLIVAFIGLAGAIFAPLVFEVQRPPPKQLSDVLADTIVKIKDKVARRGSPIPPPPQTDWRVVATITASAFGFIGAVFGTASWIRREDLRVSRTAVAIGVAAIAFHYIMAAIGVAIVCIIVASILSHFS